MTTSGKLDNKNNTPWAPGEDKQLVALLDAEATWPLIAITLGRDLESVQKRAGVLGHKRATENVGIGSKRTIQDIS
jgi:hypothetical protein